MKKPDADILKLNKPFTLESGATLGGVALAYTTYGTLNADRSNVVWVCHALTANADPSAWWPGLVGPGKFFDPADRFIVCVNMLGSCYGSTGPASIHPVDGKPYTNLFPNITIRDIVKGNQAVADHLGVKKIHLAIGGSMGGQQVLEWAITEPGRFENICLLATNARHSPWGIAFNASQRLALEQDPDFVAGKSGAGGKALAVARSIAMLSYRNYRTYDLTQKDVDPGIDHFRAAGYQAYQGEKLRKRFDPYSYYTLSKAMDSHNVGRGRGKPETVLGTVTARTLLLGLETDILFPLSEQEYLAGQIPNAKLEILNSDYGHDGFLIEYEQLTTHLEKFLKTDLCKS